MENVVRYVVVYSTAFRNLVHGVPRRKRLSSMATECTCRKKWLRPRSTSSLLMPWCKFIIYCSYIINGPCTEVKTLESSPTRVIHPIKPIPFAIIKFTFSFAAFYWKWIDYIPFQKLNSWLTDRVTGRNRFSIILHTRTHTHHHNTHVLFLSVW
jgi:hypothetical protein